MLAKYYSLDECLDHNIVKDKLEKLQDDGKIIFSIDENDIIKITDSYMSNKEIKETIAFLDKNDVIEYIDYDEDEDEFDIDEDNDIGNLDFEDF